MSIKRLKSVSMHAEQAYPLSPPFAVRFNFAFTNEGAPEDGARSIDVSVSITGSTTFAQAFSQAKAAAAPLITEEGDGGHTVLAEGD